MGLISKLIQKWCCMLVDWGDLRWQEQSFVFMLLFGIGSFATSTSHSSEYLATQPELEVRTWSSAQPVCPTSATRSFFYPDPASSQLAQSNSVNTVTTQFGNWSLQDSNSGDKSGQDDV
ncbi:hypothetical protein BJ085DRAFT_27255 [Dimargaris cristalligena]|uniref:Uncharacterized protein n=1 Tax=Dimargaris cristalligena TaxID=215637 RepID=A0A4P9ZRK1_9FUNG|nr:hypothetical protein BJ085DRAFT_27255 [Dimargaris cristalligena]|eukprot:RKP36083.1 hypothetical protein BJ085DRAFT_27255 [Dimargaris cristalligena]